MATLCSRNMGLQFTIATLKLCIDGLYSFIVYSRSTMRMLNLKFVVGCMMIRLACQWCAETAKLLSVIS